MTDEKRPYRMTRRAELEDATRRRITESAEALHAELGPARTSISAIAQLAGVRRSTIYRHFPDELSLFSACTAHWMADNPFPALDDWAAIPDADARLRCALQELYAYYRSTQDMVSNVLRDETVSPTVARMLGGYRAYMAAGCETLMKGRRSRGGARRRITAAVGHSLAFHTWRSLAIDQGLDDTDAADLIYRLVTAAAPASAVATRPTTLRSETPSLTCASQPEQAR
jgi:AcrR family transcriptional regulator